MNLANKITVLRLMLIPVFLFFMSPVSNHIMFHENNYFVAILIFVIAAITDKLDGYIARKYNQITNFGILLDPLVDKLLVAAALIILVGDHKVATWIAVVIIVREFMISSLRLIAMSKGTALAADNYGKLKLVLQTVSLTLVMMNNQPFNYITNFPIDQTALIAAVLVTLYSGVNYMIKNKHIYAG